MNRYYAAVHVDLRKDRCQPLTRKMRSITVPFTPPLQPVAAALPLQFVQQCRPRPSTTAPPFTFTFENGRPRRPARCARSLYRLRARHLRTSSAARNGRLSAPVRTAVSSSAEHYCAAVHVHLRRWAPTVDGLNALDHCSSRARHLRTSHTARSDRTSAPIRSSVVLSRALLRCRSQDLRT
jgi:hypothetical protein